MGEGSTAIVLKVGDRYYSGRTKAGRVQTAWSLPGACLFPSWRLDLLERAEEQLRAKGYKPYRVWVEAKEKRGDGQDSAASELIRKELGREASKKVLRHQQRGEPLDMEVDRC